MKQPVASRHTALGRGAEFDMIRDLETRWGDIARGLGDDAAVLDVPSGQYLIVSTDSSVENVHFRRGWLRADEIGYRAATAALSDLAAMGAQPLGMTLALVVPEEWRAELPHLGDGIAEAARAAGCVIVGGDLSRGDTLHCVCTVLGSTSRPLRRAGARVGDTVYVTGNLGGPGMALRAFESGAEPRAEHFHRFARPAARIGPGVWLGEHGASAMIDISDGLVSDAEHLARASDVHLTIRLEALPVIAGCRPQDAAHTGEEYELLLTAPPTLDVRAFQSLFQLPITAIGDVVAGAGSVTFTLDGARVDLPRGHDHFSP